MNCVLAPSGGKYFDKQEIDGHIRGKQDQKKRQLCQQIYNFQMKLIAADFAEKELKEIKKWLMTSYSPFRLLEASKVLSQLVDDGVYEIKKPNQNDQLFQSNHVTS